MTQASIRKGAAILATLAFWATASSAQNADPWSQFPDVDKRHLVFPPEDPLLLTCTEWTPYKNSERWSSREMQLLIKDFGASRAVAIAHSIDRACEAYPWMLWLQAYRLVISGDRPPAR